MTRILLFLALIFLSVSLPWWLFVLAALLYSLLYTPYELVILGALLDGYFGAGGSFMPYYTLSLTALVLGSEWLRPRLTWHEQSGL